MKEFPFKLILGSGSPRRKELLEMAGFSFSVRTIPIDESVPPNVKPTEVPKYLAIQKAREFTNELKPDEVVLTADSLVLLGERILGKPANRDEAIEFLSSISGKDHVVITGVCILSNEKQVAFDNVSRVKMAALSQSEIEYYVDTYQPFDKAGAYAIQEWIGLNGIESIEGSYYNIVGLPVHQVYAHLRDW